LGTGGKKYYQKADEEWFIHFCNNNS
jgi:hypothetical protein